MKALRLFIVRMLVVLLAVLLPLRGAVGAALACPGQGQGQPGAPCLMAGVPGSTAPEVPTLVSAYGALGADDTHGTHGGHAAHHAAATADTPMVEHGGHADAGSHTHAHAADPAEPAPSCGDMGSACAFCASGCHAAAWVPGLPTLAGSDRVEAVDYPALVAPAPRHFADGPERPPRGA